MELGDKMSLGAGRYAPSPTGDLHVGNLRTALLAWAWARTSRRRFYLRMEDLDRQRYRDPTVQVRDLAAIGIEWDGDVVTQSERLRLYEVALANLWDPGLVFECFCSRKDIQDALSASHGPAGEYPGTCLRLTKQAKDARRQKLSLAGRRPALRLAPHVKQWRVHDELHGDYEGSVGSVVLRRGDGSFAYNFVVAVDDHLMEVDQVCRGDDLLASAPTHSYLRHMLGGREPTYVHVPLVLGPTGERLAKRDGSVTLSDLSREGVGPERVLALISTSLGLAPVTSAADFLEEFSTARQNGELSLTPWKFNLER